MTSDPIYKNQKNLTFEQRAVLNKIFWESPEQTLFDQRTLCAVADIEASTAEAYRSRGGGPTFKKINSRCLYTKKDILHWLSSFPTCRSTSDITSTTTRG